MPDFPTPQDLAARTTRAVDAATGAGRELGLDVTEPVVLHDSFSVVVHLAPAPVVARVPTVLPAAENLAELEERQREELAVVDWLAARGHPVVVPSPLAPLEPVRRDGFSMTFWEHVRKSEDAEPDYARNAALIADLHGALRDYPRELPFLAALEPKLPEAADHLREHPAVLERAGLDPADLERAERQWAVLEPLVASREGFEAAFPGIPIQPVHGDAPAYNIIDTVDGKLCSDFEVITLGPVEWDLALIGPDGEARYNARAEDLGLRPLDEQVLRVVEFAGLLRGIACLALTPQLPVLAEGLKPVIEIWRATPLPV